MIVLIDGVLANLVSWLHVFFSKGMGKADKFGGCFCCCCVFVHVNQFAFSVHNEGLYSEIVALFIIL